MGLFQLRKAMHEVELIEADFKPDNLIHLSLLERSSQKVAETLERLRTGEADLEKQIETLSEELRQTRIAISAFGAAGSILTGAMAPASADTSKIGRLVPREVPA